MNSVPVTLCPVSALGSLSSVALSSAQVLTVYLIPLIPYTHHSGGAYRTEPKSSSLAQEFFLIAWYTLGDDLWYTLGDHPWYIDVRLLTPLRVRAQRLQAWGGG